jgi:hypothetical protein
VVVWCGVVWWEIIEWVVELFRKGEVEEAGSELGKMFKGVIEDFAQFKASE